MKPDPKADTATLIHRLEGVAQILETFGLDRDHAPPAAMLLLADITRGLANALLDRFDPAQCGTQEIMRG